MKVDGTVDMGVDPARFDVDEYHVVGPFYGVRVFDRLRNRKVPLARGGILLLGHGSVRRAVRYGVARYLRANGDR